MNNYHAKPSGFLTFLFAFVPGIAQLYMGLVVKGLTLLGSAAACIALMFILGSGSFAAIFIVPAIMIYAYSFFDAFSSRRRILAGQPVEDSCTLTVYIKALFSQKLFGESDEPGTTRLRLIVGIGVVVIGAVSLLNVLGYALNGFPSYLVNSIIIPLCLIVAGILLIRKGVKR